MTCAYTAWVTEPDNELEYVRDELARLGVDVVLEPSPEVDILVPFVNTPVDRNVIEGRPRLRLITTRSTGVDHIDHDAAREREIRVANVPNYESVAVAEYTFALLPQLKRLRPTIGPDLSGNVLGVIGTERPAGT